MVGIHACARLLLLGVAAAGSAGDRGAASAQAPAAETARHEYAARARALETLDLDARCALARWCQDHGLWTEMRREAGRVLAVDPDHAGAHELLGHERVDGQWMSRADAMRARGFIRYRGQWMRKYDAAVLQHREAQERARRELQRDLERQFRRLTSSSSDTRRKALVALEEVAARREWPELRDAARRWHDAAESYWREQAVVVATVRAQHTELLGLEPFTTSLGTGLPVTLQLPRTRTVSVGTTVGIPAGTGR